MMYLFMLMALIQMSLIGMDKPLVPSLINEMLDTYFVFSGTLQEKNCYLFNNFPYDLRSKILVHYGLTKKGQMFTFLWDKRNLIH